MDNDFIIASKKRMILSVYIDYIIISTLVGLFSIFILNNKEVPVYINIIIVLAIEALIAWNSGSPGMKFLSIANSKIPLTDENGNTLLKRVMLVDKTIYNNENIISLFTGILLVLEGSKQIIRWALWTSPMPFLIFQTDSMTFPVISIISGLIFLYSGYHILHLNIKGILISSIVIIIDIITTVINWSKWDEFAKIEIISRREYQGLPVDNKQLEFMQSIVPEYLLAFTIVLLILVLISYRNVKKKKESINFRE